MKSKKLEPTLPLEEGDPPAGERTWYRSVKTQDRGFLVNRGGVAYIKLDRPGHELIHRWIEEEWIPDVDKRPLSAAQVGQICHAADKQLCTFIGLRKPGGNNWADMPENERVAWCQGIGPEKPPIRRRVFDAVFNELKGYVK